MQDTGVITKVGTIEGRSVSVTSVVKVQKLASVTVTSWVPAQAPEGSSPRKGKGDIVGHSIVNAPVPPPTLVKILPSQSSGQVGSINPCTLIPMEGGAEISIPNSVQDS